MSKDKIIKFCKLFGTFTFLMILSIFGTYQDGVLETVAFVTCVNFLLAFAIVNHNKKNKNERKHNSNKKTN